MTSDLGGETATHARTYFSDAASSTKKRLVKDFLPIIDAIIDDLPLYTPFALYEARSCSARLKSGLESQPGRGGEEVAAESRVNAWKGGGSQPGW